MSVWGVSMVKDEADIVRWTVATIVEQVDHVLVADNGSTDGTRQLVESVGAEVVDDPEPAYYQSDKMSHLARVAASRGADWIVPFDADSSGGLGGPTSLRLWMSQLYRGLHGWDFDIEDGGFVVWRTRRDRVHLDRVLGPAAKVNCFEEGGWVVCLITKRPSAR
jgi:glycosyltransferase involved in cell wall biosynthesis